MPDDHLNKDSRYLSFSLGKSAYAIPLLSVKEVIAMPKITAIPQSPAFFLGVLDLRGDVIPVIDLRKRLDIKPAENQETCVIICDLASLNIGIVVDSISAVIMPAVSEISDTPPFSASKADSCITGIYRARDGMVLLLDPAQLFGAEDRAAFHKIQKQAS